MEQDQSIRAVILKSDLKSIFCAGIDFQEFLNGPERFVGGRETFNCAFSLSQIRISIAK